MALITAAEARAYIPDLSGTGEDAALDVVIGRVGEQFAALCGFPPASAGGAPSMESTAYTRYYDPARAIHDGVLHLGVWPVTALSSIYDDPDEVYGSDTEVTSSDRLLVGSAGTIRLKPLGTHAWSTFGPRAIKVTFTAGYSTIPSALKDAACRATRDLWASRHTALGSSRPDPARTGFASEILALLQPFRVGFGVTYQGEV